jgi:hypothetical protein
MTPKDHIESLQHAMLVRAGLMRIDSPALHPAAIQHLGGDLIQELSSFCGELADNARPGATARVNGISTSDFGDSITNVARVAIQRQLDASSDHLALTKIVSVLNFQPQRIVGGRIDADLLQVLEGGDYTDAAETHDDAPQVAQLLKFGRNVHLSEELLRNDDIGLIAGSVARFGGAAARLEAKMVYGVLNSNPTLADSESLFDAGHGNVVSHVDIFSEAMLAQAFEKLRNLDPDGTEAQNAAPAVLAVAPNLELIARKTVFVAGLDLKVISSPRITASTWYLLPDPEKTPVVGLLRLGGNKTPLLVDRARKKFNRDGITIAIRYLGGVVPLSRFVIRGGA